MISEPELKAFDPQMKKVDAFPSALLPTKGVIWATVAPLCTNLAQQNLQ